jgi:transposase
VAMGEARTREGARQVAMVCLDELVAEDNRYRRIDELVGEWGFVREAARPYYAERVGRPSIDPTVLLKLMLAGALEGIGSMRELLRVAALRLDLRLFLGYPLGERLPAHQTISEAQTQRFADGDVFERLFLRSVALCKEHGLIEAAISPSTASMPRRTRRCAACARASNQSPATTLARERPNSGLCPTRLSCVSLSRARGERRSARPRTRPPSRQPTRTRG